MTQVARNVTMADVGFLSSSRYLIHDRDTKFCQSFHRTIEAIGVAPVKLPTRSPDLNSFAERWVLLFIHPRAPNLIGLRSAETMPA